MIADLDPASPVPLYLQIVRSVRRLVALGALRPGDRLPTVREIAARSRVNRNTAARAVRQLETEGLVRTRVGQGTFVVDGAGRLQRRERDDALRGSIDRMIDEARELGATPDEVAPLVESRLARWRGQTPPGAGAGPRGEPRGGGR